MEGETRNQGILDPGHLGDVRTIDFPAFWPEDLGTASESISLELKTPCIQGVFQSYEKKLEHMSGNQCAGIRNSVKITLCFYF